MASVFAPLKKKLQNYQKQLQSVITSLEEADMMAYQSVPALTKGISDLREDIKRELAATTNSLETVQATNAASIAARAPSGVAQSLKQIITLILEIAEAAKCFALLGKILLLLSKMVILIGAKILEIGLAFTKLQLPKVESYLSDLKNDILKKINDARAKAIKDAKTKFYANKVKITNTNIKANTDAVASKTKELQNAGKPQTEISNDPTIKTLSEQISKDSAFIQELKEAGLA